MRNVISIPSTLIASTRPAVSDTRWVAEVRSSGRCSQEDQVGEPLFVVFLSAVCTDTFVEFGDYSGGSNGAGQTGITTTAGCRVRCLSYSDCDAFDFITNPKTGVLPCKIFRGGIGTPAYVPGTKHYSRARCTDPDLLSTTPGE